MAHSAATRDGPREGRVRARTRALLLDAAVRVFARKGAGAAAIHEIAAEAGVANGTFYNYFRSRDELLDAASGRLAERLHGEIAASRAAVDDPAERLAIGCRRFILQALHDPTWGAALLRVWGGSAVLNVQTSAPMRTDLRTGRRLKRLRYADETAAADLVQGTVLAAMRTVLEGRAGEEHASAVAALILRGLGVEAADADAIAARPLPPLGTPRAVRAAPVPRGVARPHRRRRS
jgi:AcrR family transcriptional regulator